MYQQELEPNQDTQKLVSPQMQNKKLDTMTMYSRNMKQNDIVNNSEIIQLQNIERQIQDPNQSYSNGLYDPKSNRPSSANNRGNKVLPNIRKTDHSIHRFDNGDENEIVPQFPTLPRQSNQPQDNDDMQKQQQTRNNFIDQPPDGADDDTNEQLYEHNQNYNYNNFEPSSRIKSQPISREQLQYALHNRDDYEHSQNGDVNQVKDYLFYPSNPRTQKVSPSRTIKKQKKFSPHKYIDIPSNNMDKTGWTHYGCLHCLQKNAQSMKKDRQADLTKKLKKENNDLKGELEKEKNHFVGCLSNLRELRKREFGNSPDKLSMGEKYSFVYELGQWERSIRELKLKIKNKETDKQRNDQRKQYPTRPDPQSTPLYQARPQNFPQQQQAYQIPIKQQMQMQPQIVQQVDHSKIADLNGQINLLQKRIEEMKQEINKKDMHIMELHKNLGAANNEFEHFMAENNALKKKLTETSGNLITKEELLVIREQELDNLKKQMEKVATRFKNIHSQIENYKKMEQDHTQMQKEFKLKLQELHQKEEENENLRKQNHSLTEETNQIKNHFMDIKQDYDQMRNMKYQYMASQRKMEKMKEENLNLKLELEHRINTLKDENDELKQALRRQLKDMKNIKGQDNYETEYQFYKDKYTELQQQVQKLNDPRFNNLPDQLQLSQELQEKQSHQRDLQNRYNQMVENYEQKLLSRDASYLQLEQAKDQEIQKMAKQLNSLKQSIHNYESFNSKQKHKPLQYSPERPENNYSNSTLKQNQMSQEKLQGELDFRMKERNLLTLEINKQRFEIEELQKRVEQESINSQHKEQQIIKMKDHEKLLNKDIGELKLELQRHKQK